MFDYTKYFLMIVLLLTLITCNLPPKKPFDKSLTYYDNIVVDLIYTDTSCPSSSSLTFFESKIKQYNIAKKVTIITRKIEDTKTDPWNTPRLRYLEHRNRALHDPDLEDRHLILYIACIPGKYVQGELSEIAGLKYGSTSFAIFTDYSSSRTEGLVFFHELCHVLHLVNIEARGEKPVNPDRPTHCNNKNCIMFWTISRQTCLDEACIDDLHVLILQRN